MSEENQNSEWLSVIGKSLAFLCIHSTDLKDKGMAEQANFLKVLGMSNANIASLLSTSESSIRGLLVPFPEIKVVFSFSCCDYYDSGGIYL